MIVPSISSSNCPDRMTALSDHSPSTLPVEFVRRPEILHHPTTRRRPIPLQPAIVQHNLSTAPPITITHSTSKRSSAQHS